MRRIILTVLLCLCLVGGAMPNAVWADTIALNQENLSTYTTSDKMLELQNGSYKLTSDITISKTLEISGDVTLDLNGYVLSLAEGSTGSVIKVDEERPLTITDSRPDAEHRFSVDTKTGLWTLDETNGTQIVKGGVITGGNATTGHNGIGEAYGGGIYVSGTLELQGGNIVGCGAEDQGGAICTSQDNGGTPPVVTISGGAIFGCDNGDAYGICAVGVAQTKVAISEGKCDCRIYIDGSDFTMNGGEVKYLNIAHNEKENITIEITGGTIGSCRIAKTTATISGGTFKGEVDNGGSISGGTFKKNVTGNGTITGGLFYGTTGNNTINGKTVDYKINNEYYAKQVLRSGNKATSLTPEGYSNFSNWYSDENCTHKYEFNGGVTNNMTLYTTGKLTDYQITYNLDGGSVENNANPATYTVKSDDITLTAPIKVGYIFAGWSGTDITGQSKNITIAKGSIGDRTYTANWAQCTEHQYSSPKDTTCDLCGHVRTVYYSITQKPVVITPENGSITLSYNGRTATITPDEGYEIASVMVNGVDKGVVSTLTGLKTGDKIEVIFQKTKETLDTEVKDAVAGIDSMKARTSKTTKGNIKVVLDLSDEEKAMIANFKEQGYTVKYRFYRSTKKSSGYAARIEKDTDTFINTVGKKGTKYYYKVRIMVYDAEGDLVANTELKNCKYAARVW